MNNLNESVFRGDSPNDHLDPKLLQYLKLQKTNTESLENHIEVYFRDIEKALLNWLKFAQNSVVLGAVAWLTNEKILKALSQVHSAHIIVQKEDFLRPDGNNTSNWPAKLRRLYDALPSPVARHELGEFVAGLSYCGDPLFDAVRCVGNHNSDKNPAFPRMHNKFLVFANLKKDTTVDFESFECVPWGVWTGSFNFTKNATNSLENALFIHDKKIIDAYFKEWQQIAALSEPLDWEFPWVAPEWRVGS